MPPISFVPVAPPAKLSQEELVDVERQKQIADKLSGCPFFAGIKREDAPAALKKHEAVIKERQMSSNKLCPAPSMNKDSEADQ